MSLFGSRCGTGSGIGCAVLLGMSVLVGACPASSPGDAPPDAGTAPGADAGLSPPDGGAAAPLCSIDGWCWRNPLPQGNSLNAVFAAAADRIWAVGDRGMILFFDGREWRLQQSGTTEILNSIWGTDASNLWIAGTGGTVLR